MVEANPPNCQLVRAIYSDDPFGDCPVASCGTSIEYKPPQMVISVDPDRIVCDAARRILEEDQRGTLGAN